MSGAVAIWVKTPGLSPVKTRLAHGIGVAAAEDFYRRSADAVGAVVRRAAERLPGPLTPYWAVAESGSDAWGEFATVLQGTGGLGERLAHVYDLLLEQHDRVIFLGADAPQLTPGVLECAAGIAAAGRFALGPAEDGGFYLFAGSRPIPREVWTAIPYSDAATLRELDRGLRPLAPVEHLGSLFDVDTADELARLRDELAGLAEPLPEQRSLAEWLAPWSHSAGSAAGT